MVKLVLEHHHRSLGVVTLMFGLHHGSLGGDLEKSQSGRASACASP